MLIKVIVRGLSRAIVGLLVLVISLYLLLWAINWQDAAPSPESVQLQQILQAQLPVPDQDNGYLYYRQYLANAVDLPEALRMLLRCELDQCLTELKAAQTELPVLLAQQQPQLDTYQTLLNYPAWQYPLHQQSSELPAVSPLIAMQQLFLIDVWLKVQTGDLATAKTMLQQDLNFWRQQLISANNLLYKSIAVSRVERHFNFALMLRQSIGETRYQLLMPEAWRQPLHPDEMSLLLAMAGEWRFSASVVESLKQFRPDDQNVLERWLTLDLWQPFFKPQAMNNTLALINMACVEQQSAQALVAYPWYHWLYNPLGKIFTQTGIDTCLSQHKRLADLEEKRRQITMG